LPIFPPEGVVEGIPPIGVEEALPNDEGIFPKLFELVDDDKFPNGSNPPPLEALVPFAVVEILLPNVALGVEVLGKFPKVEVDVEDDEKFPKEFADEELLEAFPNDEGIFPKLFELVEFVDKFPNGSNAPVLELPDPLVFGAPTPLGIFPNDVELVFAVE